MIDSHIHVGQFNDIYIEPSVIHDLMAGLNVDYYAVSSTTICEENYPKAIDELQEIIWLDKDKVIPVMWITPDGLNGNIAWYLETSIKWRCLKIHPFLHPDVWTNADGKMSEVIDIAKELDIPVLIHTGNEVSCQSNQFEAIIANNPDVLFILAHGRPLNQTIRIVKRFDNAFADTAFMPIGQIKAFIESGLSHKVLWGTDMCIPKYFYPSCDLFQYYKGKLTELATICSPKQYRQITHDNAIIIFNLK
ncbi:MAG: amidohydrolase family protein [Paramuribaculum sp.]|nr:amidohydrolase family protein [Paramuribaculum sp.]